MERAPIAVLLHVPDVVDAAAYLSVLSRAEVEVIIVGVEPAASVGGATVLASTAEDDLAQWADAVAAGVLAGRSTVLRHVHDGPDAFERLVRFLGPSGIEVLDARVHDSLERLGFATFRPGESDSRRELVAASELITRVVGASRRLGADDRSLATVALRGFAAAGLPAELLTAGGRTAELAVIAFLELSSLELEREVEVARTPRFARATRARGWAVRSAVPIGERESAAAAALGIDGFLVRFVRADGEWDSAGFLDSLDEAPTQTWAPVVLFAPEDRVAAAISGLDPATIDDIARYTAAATARGTVLAIDDRPVVVLGDTEASVGGDALVVALRSALAAQHGRDPWIAVTESPALVQADRVWLPDGLDGVVQIPPSSFDLRKRVYRAPGFEDFEGRVVNVSGLAGETNSTLAARVMDTVIPGAFARFDTTAALGLHGTIGHQWNLMRFRAMLERAVRSVAGRGDERRIVVVNSWNGLDDLSGIANDGLPNAYADAMADALAGRIPA